MRGYHQEISIPTAPNEAGDAPTLTVRSEYVNPSSMGKYFFRRAVCLLILSGCATTVPDLQPPPEGLVWSPIAPFQHETKVEPPAEAKGLSHFMMGQLLLGDGDFDQALKEFETAAQDNPNDSFLRFRLA